MKICQTCQSKPTATNAIVAKESDDFRKYYPPVTTKPHKTGNISMHLTGLKPNSTIFYFASKSCNVILIRKYAYGKLENSGIVNTNDKGEATVRLNCPGVYVNPEDSSIYPRHFHYCYKVKDNWGNKLYTQKVICNVTKKDLLAGSGIIVDALPAEYYAKKKILNAVNIPSTLSLTHVKELADKHIGNINTKIYVYCWNESCHAAEKLMEKLGKVGYHNTYHYPSGVEKW